MAQAIPSQGFLLEIGDVGSPPAFVEVGEIANCNLFQGQAAEIDVTHLQSTAKEFLMGLQDFGNCDFDANYVPNDTGQLAVSAAKASRDLKQFRCTFSDNSTAIFNGYVLSFVITGGVDGKMDLSFSVRTTGDVVGI